MVELVKPDRLMVHSGEGAGPYLICPIDRLDAVTSILRKNGMSFWMGSKAISVNGRPEVIFIYIQSEQTAADIQRLLDAAA